MNPDFAGYYQRDSSSSFESQEHLNPRKILEKEGFRITDPQPSAHLHGAVRYDKFPGLPQSKRVALDGLVNMARKYVAMPIIQDEFGDDDWARREKRQSIDRMYGREIYEFLFENKLRLNAMTRIIMYLDLVCSYLDEENIHSDAAGALRKAGAELHSLSKTYRHLDDIHEQLIVVDQIDKIARLILSELVEPENEDQEAEEEAA